jgi:hypothetical protein
MLLMLLLLLLMLLMLLMLLQWRRVHLPVRGVHLRRRRCR